MNEKAIDAYRIAVQKTASPRQFEAGLLCKAASMLQDSIETQTPESRERRLAALHYNRRLWVSFAASAVDDDHPLPLSLKNNIANLAVFVFQRTVDFQIDPTPEKMKILVRINRQLAAGLQEDAGEERDAPTAG